MRGGGGSVTAVDAELTPLGHDDIDAVHDLVRRWEIHWNVPLVTPRSEIVEDFESPGFVPELDSRGVWSGDRLLAMGSVSHIESGIRLERAIVTGRVDPLTRGIGLGRRLLAWQIERAAERLRQCDPVIPWYIRAYEWEWIEDTHRLHRRLGLEAVRWFEDLVRPLDDLPSPVVPSGIDIVPWDDAPAEALRQVSNDSFSDHWGSTPRSTEAWTHVVDASSVRRDLSLAATSGGEVVALCLNSHFVDDVAVTGRVDGWIDLLGVVPRWRRKGLASALIAASLEAFKAAGFTHAMIAVDQDNPTGASGLYRNLGFELLNRSVTSELRIKPFNR